MFERFPQKLFICFYSSAVLFDDCELKELTPSTSATYLEVMKDYKLYFSDRIQQSGHVSSVFFCCKDFLAWVGETRFLLIIVVLSFFVLLSLKVGSSGSSKIIRWFRLQNKEVRVIFDLTGSKTYRSFFRIISKISLNNYIRVSYTIKKSSFSHSVQIVCIPTIEETESTFLFITLQNPFLRKSVILFWCWDYFIYIVSMIC